MEDKDKVAVSDNIETGKKKYTLSGVAIVEMICSAILVIALFLPWVRIEGGGESKLVSLMEHGPLAFIYGAVFIFNIVLKFFKRSRWLSVVVAIIAILMHTELGAEKLNASPHFYPVSYYPAIGEQIVFMVGLALMAVVFISWLASKWTSIVEAYRHKNYFTVYSSSLGLFFIVLLAMLLGGIAFTGNADKFFEGEDSPYKIAIAAFFGIGMAVFFCWGCIGVITWMIHKIRGGSYNHVNDVAGENADGASSPDNSPKSKKNLLVGIAIALLFLLICVRYLHTCSYTRNDTDISSVEKSETVKNDAAVAKEENTEKTSTPPTQQFTIFEENGKAGVKDASGKIVIPAEYDKESISMDDDNQISSTGDDGIAIYFKKTSQLLSHIGAIYRSTNGGTLYYFKDKDSHAFYTNDGQIKASGLSGDIFCLRKVDPQTGYGVKTYYGFRNKENNDDYMPVYDDEGNRVCTFTVNGWQLFGIDHLTRNEDEPRDFEKEFTFTIDLDDFINHHSSVVHR